MSKNNKKMTFSRIFVIFRGLTQRVATGAVIGLVCGLTGLFPAESSRAQGDEIDIVGEWRMELRILRSPGLVTHQQNIRIFVIEQMPDSTYRVLTHLTTRAVADEVGRLSRPECEGKRECIYDSGSEGIGRLVGNKFHIDWLDESWIDDVFTVLGSLMTGDDGNGPLEFTKGE